MNFFSLALTVEALQDKTCQDLLLLGGVGQFEPRFQGEGVVPGEYFLLSTKLDTFCYLTVQTALCYVQSFFDTIPACDRRTDGQTDGIAVASRALVMRALQCAVKMRNCIGLISRLKCLVVKLLKLKMNEACEVDSLGTTMLLELSEISDTHSDIYRAYAR